MPDIEAELPDEIEDHIALTQPDSFEQTTDATMLHGKHIFADPKDGKEKEATVRSHHAGASSEAPASSGIPSAVKQHGLRDEAIQSQDETPMGDRHIPTRQDLEP